MADKVLMAKNKFLAVVILAVLLAMPAPVWAVGSAGFENASYSAKTLSQANAVVARPQDGSTILFNPAGIGELPGIQTNLGIQALDWRIFHRDNGTGDFTQNDFKIIPIPSAYLTVNPGKGFLDDRLAAGIALNSPFGLSSSFPVGSVAKFAGIKNDLKMVASTAAASVKITDWLRLGGGATYYNIYKYRQTFNYPNTFILGGLPSPDGKATTDADGWGWGWNSGLLIKPFRHHRLGMSYRSRANVKVDGQVQIEDIVLAVAQGFPTSDPFFMTGIHSDIGIPANLTLGYAYEPSPKWSAEMDVGLTFWNAFKDQDYAFDQPTALLRALGTVPRDYDTTWNFHFGGKRQLNKKWDVMGGFAFYEAASPKKHVDNFLPDANRYLWTMGTTYHWTRSIDLDFNYFFMLFGSRHISNPEQAARTGDNIDGRFTSIIHGPMFSFNYKFDLAE